MKISSVQATMHNIPVHVPLLEKTLERPIIFVEINTDEGLTGSGEPFYGPGAAEAHIHHRNIKMR